MLTIQIPQPMKTIAVILIMLGVATLSWTAFAGTSQKNVTHPDPSEVAVEQDDMMVWPVYAGGIVLAGSLFLLFSPRKTIV